MTSSFKWIDDIVSHFGIIAPTTRSRRHPTDADILLTEKAIGGKIGDDVVYFLSRYGDTMLGDQSGSVMFRNENIEIIGDDAVCPGAFLSLSVNGAHSILEIAQLARTPKGLLPVSIDASANLVCIDLSRANGPVVYYYRTKTASPWIMVDIAASFREFLTGLQKDPY